MRSYFFKLGQILNKSRLTSAASLVSFIVFILLCSADSAHAQTELKFNDASPILETGTALTQGARYRFRTVAPGTDALVTLTTISGATLVGLDDNTTNANRFQPTIRTNGTNIATSYVRFTFQLVAAGTATARPVPSVYLSAQDVDGNGTASGIREWAEFAGTNTVTVAGTTLLSAATALVGGTRYIQSASANAQAGIGTDDRYEIYTTLNSSLSTFTIGAGNVTGADGCAVGEPSCDRQFSFAFDPASSNQTTPAPDLSLTVSAPYAAAPSTVYTSTLTVTNNGPTSANGSTLSASLPAAFVPTAWGCTGFGGAVCGSISSAQDIFITTLPVGGQAVFTLSGYISSAGTYTTTATISPPNGSSDPNTLNNSGSVTTQIGSVADLKMVMSQRSGTSGTFVTTALSANRLTTVQYQLVVTNQGSSSVSGASFTSAIPSNITGLSVASANGVSTTTCSASFGSAPNQNILTGSFSASSGGTCTIIVQGTLSTPGTIAPSATVAPTNYAAAGDPDCTSSPIVCGGNNVAGVSTTIVGVYYISGTVFEDVNYGGGAGRSLASSGGAGVSNARVELYSAAGSFVSSTTSAANGTFQFSDLSPASYTVRVVNSTVVSNRSGYNSGVIGVQTFVYGITSRVGGEVPSKVDAASNTTNQTLAALTNSTTTPQSIASVDATVDRTDVDFGFNFDTVVNTNNAGQGSLRQAITNANTLTGDGSLAQVSRASGVENVVFMISNGTTGSGGSLSLSGGLRTENNYFTSGVATISPTSTLTSIDNPLIVDARTQPGWTSAPIIEINGTSAGGGAVAFRVYSGSATLRGFVINRFSGNGIELLNLGGNVVEGCYVGLNAAGTATSSNTGVGINMYNSPNNRIGGTTTGAGNVIAGNSTNAIVFSGASGSGIVQGNIIGLNAAGNARIGGVGVYVGAPNVTVGGTTAAERNVISGATYENIQFGNGSTGSVLKGNYIGTDASGAATIANGWAGVAINGVNGITIGGTENGAGNLIAGTSGPGVAVMGSSTGNPILGNRFFSNSGLAIDLGSNGPTDNDNTKTSGQPNLLMDYPTITAANLWGSNLTLAGHIGTAPGQTDFGLSRVEIYVSDNSSPRGQGQTYLGFITADANGNFTGAIANVTGITAGSTKLVATATDTSNNTSEFGSSATVTTLGPIIALSKDVTPNGTQLPGTDLTYTIAFANNGGLGAADFTLVDPDPSNVAMRLNTSMDFKIGSVAASLGTTGITVTVGYSNDNGATFNYVPVSEAGGAPAGYDATVTNIRWTFTGTLSSASPNNAGTISFTARIR